MVTIKNGLSVLVKTLCSTVCGGVVYWLCGYALSYGDSNTVANWFCGWGRFALHGETAGIQGHFFYQLVLASISTVIALGIVLVFL